MASSGLAGGEGRSWGCVRARTRTEGEATPCWVLLCSAVAVWILPEVQLYITVSELGVCAAAVGCGAGEGPAGERAVLTRLAKCNTGGRSLPGSAARSNLFCTNIRVRKRIGSIFWFYVLLGLFYFGLVN